MATTFGWVVVHHHAAHCCPGAHPVVDGCPRGFSDQGSVRYFENGPEGGPEVLFVHGLLVNADLCRYVAAEVAAEGFRTLAVDWPLGSHELAMPEADLSPPAVADLIASFMDEPELDDVTVVANDTGGVLTQILMVRHPERIGRVVLTPSDSFERFFPLCSACSPDSQRCPEGRGSSFAPFNSDSFSDSRWPSAGSRSGPWTPTHWTHTFVPPDAAPRYAATSASSCGECTDVIPRLLRIVFTSSSDLYCLHGRWRTTSSPSVSPSGLPTYSPEPSSARSATHAHSSLKTNPWFWLASSSSLLAAMPPLSQRERREATRGALLHAGRDLFATRGFLAVPADEIVAAAGVTGGALHHHFQDKRGLFRAVLEVLEAEIADELGQLLSHGETDLVRRALSGFLDICERPGVRQIALTDAPAVLGRKTWREVETAHGLGLLIMIFEGGRQGSETTSSMLAQLVLSAVIEGALLVSNAKDPAQTRRDVERSLIELFGDLVD